MPVEELLRRAYADELETVANYLALSVALDGLSAQEVKESLAEDVGEELGHARRLAERIKEVGGVPPGSLALDFRQRHLQPPPETTDVVSVVRGVIEAEDEAIRTYRELVDAARGAEDHVTEHLATEILADEEKHRTLFRGFLRAIERGAEPGARPASRAR